MEKVSILIPVYNRCDLVKSAIDSALAQTYQNIEIIICDNCSTDTTWEVIQQYAAKHKNIIAQRNPENLGPVRNWMRCLDLATGQYGTFLYSDDSLHEKFVSLTLEQMAPHVGFTGTGFNIVHSSGKIVTSEFDKWPKEIESCKFIMDKTIYGRWQLPVTPVCAMFRINDIRSSLLLNIPNPHNLNFPKYGAGNDVLIYLLTAIKYKSVRYIKKPLVNLAHHEGSLSIANKLYPYYFFAYEHFFSKYYVGQKNNWHAYNAIRIKLSRSFRSALGNEFTISESRLRNQLQMLARYPLGRYLSI